MSPRWFRVAIALLIVHIAVGVARIPSKVWGERQDAISHHHEVGAARYHVGNEHHFGADVIERILGDSQEDTVVLWRGEWKGAMEFAPALLAPRLLIPAGKCPKDATSWRGHDLATVRNSSGDLVVPVLVGTGAGIELELR